MTVVWVLAVLICFVVVVVVLMPGCSRRMGGYVVVGTTAFSMCVVPSSPLPPPLITIEAIRVMVEAIVILMATAIVTTGY